MKLSVRIVVLFISVCLNSFGQSTNASFKTGSLIIPMDNSKQNLIPSQIAFNVKAYGLVNALLQNHIPVHWIIKDGKVKDEVDFSVLAGRISPSATASVLTDFRSGPFVIDSLWASTAMPIITAYGNNVAVYRAQAAFTAPVRYQLMFKPKIAVFTNGNSQLIHTKALRLAGFSSPAHFDSIPAQNANAVSCYTFGCEPHWTNGQNAVTNVVTSFLNSGGNFFAQCVGISAYEDIEHYHTTNGIEYETSSFDQDNNNIYLGTDNPLMQFEGNLTNAPTGTIVNYKNNSGAYQPLTQFLVKKSPTPAAGAADGDVVMSTRKVGGALLGGNATYLGGHDYLRGTFDLLDLGLLGLDYARANDVTWNNGLRILYNAIFVPSTRPTACEFVFAGEAKVSLGINNTTPCLNDTLQYTISFTNAGPGTAHTILVKTAPLPAGLTYVSSVAGQGTYSAGTNDWTIGQMAPNTTVQLTIRYKVIADGTYTLKAYNANLIAGNDFAEDTSSLVFTTNQNNPVLVAPVAVNASTNSGCTAVGVNLGTPTVTDDCGIASLTNNAPSTYPLGTTTVTWTVTDNSGNTVTATQLVTISDTENPTITAPASISVFPVMNCDTSGITLGTPITSDNCGVASVTNNAPAVFSTGTTTVVWTVTDNAGNTTTANQLVTVTDNQNPTITAPANISVFPTTTCDTTLNLGTPVIADNCGVASVTNNAPASFALGTTTVIWTVTDNSGNTATANQTVTVTDTENPTITAPADITTSTNSACTATGVNLGTPVTNDNCTVSSVTNDAPASFPLGTTTVTWTVTDNSGNSASASQTVTITDNENPLITAPAAISVFPTLTCDTAISNLGAPATSDNCGVASVTNNAPAVFPSGVTTVVWTVTDNAGNTSTANQTVTVSDNQNPTITAPANISVFPITTCDTTLNLGTPVTSDNCTVSSVTNNAPATFSVGTTTVIWTVTDNSGNTATANQTVTVTDNQNPTITAPADIATSTNSACTVTGVNLGTPVTNDNCTVSSVTNNAPSSFPLGTTTVIWTVTDNSGNTATANQTVTVTDNQNPTITAPADLSVFPVTTCDTTLNIGTPTTSDNCGVASVTNNAPSTFTLGTTTVIWTVTDNSGNTATANQTVTVTDNQDPTITTPASINVATNSGCTATGVNLGVPITADNCGVASVTNDAPISFPLGNTLVTWTVTDNSGNLVVATQTVSVVDSEAPVISNCNDTIKSCESLVNFQLPTAVDNCTLAGLTQTDGTALTSGSSFPDGYTLLHYEALDVAGNQAVCTKVIYKIIIPNAPDAGEDQTIYANETVLNAVQDAHGTGEWNVIEGSADIADHTNPKSAVSGLQKGNTVLSWSMSNEGCESGTDTLVITFVDLDIPNAFSPDGDSRNDFFEIKGIESYGPAQMIISNRWGEIVYESSNYVNDWSGQNKNGQELTNDTYYYQLILKDKSEFSGFVIVKRK
ncbi:MAG: HYR domain-containing protein [Fluviicola sp.]